MAGVRLRAVAWCRIRLGVLDWRWPACRRATGGWPGGRGEARVVREGLSWRTRAERRAPVVQPRTGGLTARLAYENLPSAHGATASAAGRGAGKWNTKFLRIRIRMISSF